MAKSVRKIGILGGSFNPIHHGHLFMAWAAMEGLGLDRVIFVPANCSPYKTDRDLAPAKHRLAMTRLAVRDQKNFIVSDVEIKRGGVSYTVDTARYFRRCYPKDRLFFIIGEDSIRGLGDWKNIDGILSILSFIAVNRERCPVSSSQIRRRLSGKQSIQGLTPAAVIGYIRQKGLYVQ
jgi:nicotinate-nucleotide adenylyltransferase